MIYGSQNENNAFLEYSELKKSENNTISVMKSGMWVNPTYPEFGCSPDGLVETPGELGGLLEIKCPKILERCAPLSIISNLTKQQLASFCCKYENDKLVLKKVTVITIKSRCRWRFAIRPGAILLFGRQRE